MPRFGLGRMAALSVFGWAANPQDLAEITECPAIMYGAPFPTLIVAIDSPIWRDVRSFHAGVEMVS